MQVSLQDFLEGKNCNRLILMSATRRLNTGYTSLIHQVMSKMLQDHPFDLNLKLVVGNPWTGALICEVLRSIPRYFFVSPRSIGRQNGFRHRAPLKQREMRVELRKMEADILVLGPAAYRDPKRVSLGIDKAMEFYRWVEALSGFNHDEMTCREMACVLAKGNRLTDLWDFLKEMARVEGGGIVTTSTVTCLIKVLGEEGLVDESVAAFYRMKQFRCKPDVYSYNVLIHSLCRVGKFNKARFLLEQMELPGFRCPPDIYTYTILINSYCKHSMQTGSRKATRRRLYEANHLFRVMLFKGFVPDVVTYNCLINGCCKTYRIERALELLDDMNKRGCVPNRITYNSFIRYFSAVNEIEKAVEMMRRMQEMSHGTPTTSSHTPIIHALCEAGRFLEARDFLVELVASGSIPREYTYKLVCECLSSVGETDLLDNELHKRIRNGIELRSKQVMKLKIKPIKSVRTVAMTEMEV